MKLGKYFEELKIGNKFETLSRTVTETDIVNFVAFMGAYEELFISIEYIKKESIFKKRVAPGPLIFTYAEGLGVISGFWEHTGIAILGVDEMRMLAPVECGDTIRVEIEVVDLRESKKPDRGIVITKHRVRNQRDEIVMTYSTTHLVRRKKGDKKE